MQLNLIDIIFFTNIFLLNMYEILKCETRTIRNKCGSVKRKFDSLNY